MECSRQPDGSAIATELLASANSWLWGSWAMSVGLSLGLWSVRRVRMRCLWRLRGSPRLCSSSRLRGSPSLRRASRLSSVVKS